MKRLVLILLVTIYASGGQAYAACPSAALGNTAEEINAASQRIVCLQNEVAASARQRDLESRQDALKNAQQDLQIQRRMDALPDLPVYEPPVPSIASDL